MTDIENITTAKESTVSDTITTTVVDPAITPSGEPAPAAPAPAPEPALEQEPEIKPNAEAAKYRTQLRAAEKARDTALEQVDTLRRDIIDDLLEREHKIKPAAFWANGNTVDALLGEDGRIDRDAVATAVDAAVRALGLHPPVGVHVPTEGSTPDLSSVTSWASVLNPRGRR